jgi:hypothetical protein
MEWIVITIESTDVSFLTPITLYRNCHTYRAERIQEWSDGSQQHLASFLVEEESFL